MPLLIAVYFQVKYGYSYVLHNFHLLKKCKRLLQTSVEHVLNIEYVVFVKLYDRCAYTNKNSTINSVLLIWNVLQFRKIMLILHVNYYQYLSVIILPLGKFKLLHL